MPLKVFAKEENSGSPLTGYMTKGIWYYKARTTGVRVNVSAKKLNEIFGNLLKEFEYRKDCETKLKIALKTGLKERMQDQFANSIRLKKRFTELKTLLDKIEERYVTGELAKELYEKFELRYNKEMENIKSELEKSSFDSSNFEKVVEKCLSIAKNVSQLWISADFARKQKLQYLRFPEGILYSKKNNRVRTGRVNSLFFKIPVVTRLLEGREKGNSFQNCLKSNPVPGTGFEPAQPFGCCHLKTVRLPISPPGLSSFLTGLF